MDTFNKFPENFSDRIIDRANVIILYLDTEGKVSVCNKKLEELTSKDKPELIGQHWANVLYCNMNTPIKQQMFKAVMENSITYKRSNVFEGLLTDNKGVEHVILWSITPIVSDTNDFEGVLLMGNDITHLKEREALLKKIDESMKNIMSNIKEYALFVTNLEGNITYFGMGSEIIFGWNKNDIIFKNIKLLFPEEDSKFDFILQEVNRSGRFENEIYLMRKEGGLFPAHMSVSQLQDTEGIQVGYIFIAKEITERKKLEYQMLQSEKRAAIGELAAGIAHEINNPLFVISGRLELLLETENLDPSLKEDLSIIFGQADRIRNLVNNLLKFSRNTPLTFQMLQINDVIEGVLPLLSYHKLPSSNIIIEKNFGKNIPAIKGDFNQLQELFINLFLNAYQSMPEGGRLSIATMTSNDNNIMIQVSDTGCGIHPSDIKNIFLPFFSTKKDGTGLGLSVSYNIVKNHNGRIDVESQVGKGTTFIIKLPFIPEGG